MTRDDLSMYAIASGGEINDNGVWRFDRDELQRFAALVADEKAAAHFNRVMLERGVDVENLTAERDELREQVARLVGMRDEVLHYQREFHRLRADAERYRWLRNKAREKLLYPARAGDEVPDLRTKWSIPTLICSGPVGGFRSFDEAIDAARGES